MSYNKAITYMKKQTGYFTTEEIGTHLLDENLEVGIDKVKLLLNVTRVICPQNYWQSSTQKKIPRGYIDIHRTTCPSFRFGELSIGYSEIQSEKIGWVEFNPSKVINQNGDLADIGECFEAIDIALRTTTDYYKFDTDPRKIKLDRLDLTVDFDPVADMLGLLDLAKLSKPYLQQKSSTYFDARSRENQTVMFATKKTGTTMFYNKSKEQKINGDHFRIEVQVKRRELLDKGPEALCELSMAALRPLFTNRIGTFANLCYSRPSSQIDQILTSTTETAHLIDLAGIEYLNKFGVSTKKSDHFVKKDRRFRKAYKFQKLEDLI